MVLTAWETTAFFEDADQMAFLHCTRDGSLSREGISSVYDIREWDDNNCNQWVMNCKRPDRIVDPANPLLLIAQAPFTLYVKSLKRLKGATKLICHYNNVSIEPTAPNIRWTVTETYKIQRKSMAEQANNPSPSVPKLGNKTTDVKWNDATKVHAGQVSGA